MCGREFTPNKANEDWDSWNSIPKKKSEEEVDGLLRRWDLERREYSEWRVGKASSDLEWSDLASKNIRNVNGRGVGWDRMRRRRVSVRWITPVSDEDWRSVKSVIRSEDERIGDRKKEKRRRKGMVEIDDIVVVRWCDEKGETFGSVVILGEGW